MGEVIKWKENCAILASKYENARKAMEVHMANQVNLKASNQSLISRVRELEKLLELGNKEKSEMVQKWQEQHEKTKVAYEAKMAKATAALKTLTCKYHKVLTELKSIKENVSDMTFSPQGDSTKKFTP